MPVKVNVKSCSQLGDRLLCLLSAEQTVDDPVKLLCRDQITIRSVHKNVLRASSGYFRQLFIKDPRATRPVNVPISSAILDVIIEFIYTTRMITIEIEQLIELFSASLLLQVDELTIQLKEFFLDCIADCLQTEGFLSSQSYDDVARFLTMFPLPLGDRGRLKLIEMLYSWSEKQSIEHAGIGALVARVASRPSCILTHKPFPTTLRPEAAPLLICRNKMYEVANGRLIELDYPQTTIDKLFRGLYPFVVGNEGYVCTSDEIAVFDMGTGAPLRSIRVPRKWKDWTPALWSMGDRLYAWREDKVYQLRKDGFRKLCRTRYEIDSLCVFEHDSDDLLKLCYMSSDGRLSFVSYDATGHMVSEDPIVPGIVCLIGVHEDNIIAVMDSGELAVIHGRSLVWKHAFERAVEGYVSCWRNIAVQYSNNKHICTVDIVTHSIREIPAPVGRLTFREFVD